MLVEVFKKTNFGPLFDFQITDYVSIDISKTNLELSKIDTSNSAHFSDFVSNYLKAKNAKVAFGGYLEERNIYKRSDNFNSREDERFIHLGIDLWTKAYTNFLAPYKGKVHSFALNEGLGNYGPTIILEHHIKGQKFYTLYGHLTKDSIEDIRVGETIDKGEIIGAIGNFPINGDYPPHLHFQVIKDMKGMKGDFPGVTSLKNLEIDTENCPDPNLIMKLKT